MQILRGAFDVQKGVEAKSKQARIGAEGIVVNRGIDDLRGSCPSCRPDMKPIMVIGNIGIAVGVPILHRADKAVVVEVAGDGPIEAASRDAMVHIGIIDMVKFGIVSSLSVMDAPAHIGENQVVSVDAG